MAGVYAQKAMNKSVASKQPEREAMPSQEVSKKRPTPERFAALSRVGVALLSELNEERLLHLIAEAACEITSATFAAFTLRPISETGQPLVPSEGSFFYLAAIVGVTKEAQAAKTNLWYPQDARQAISDLKAGKGSALFLMNATPPQVVREIAEAGEVMPQKSTFFYPKVATGLTIHLLEP